MYMLPSSQIWWRSGSETSLGNQDEGREMDCNLLKAGMSVIQV